MLTYNLLFAAAGVVNMRLSSFTDAISSFVLLALKMQKSLPAEPTYTLPSATSTVDQT